jgi:hypothetical protein
VDRLGHPARPDHRLAGRRFDKKTQKTFRAVVIPAYFFAVYTRDEFQSCTRVFRGCDRILRFASAGR